MTKYQREVPDNVIISDLSKCPTPGCGHYDSFAKFKRTDGKPGKWYICTWCKLLIRYEKQD